MTAPLDARRPRPNAVDALRSPMRMAGALTLALAWAFVPATTAFSAPASLTDVQEAYKAGRTADAFKKLDALIASRPADANLRFQKGVMLVDQKRSNEAIALFQKMVQDFPFLPEPLNNLAVLYVERGELEKARATLESAIRSKPNYGTAFQNLGDLYTRMASKAYARALQIDDADSTPKLVLIRNLYETAEPHPNELWVTPGPGGSLPPVTVATRPPATNSATASLPAVSAAGTARVSSTPLRQAASTPTLASTGRPASSTANTMLAASASYVAVEGVARASDSKPPVKAPVTPLTSGEAGEVAVVTAAVHAWALAWSRKDLNDYFNAYIPGYKAGDASSAAWQAARRLRILGKSNIKVDVSNIKVEIDGTVARASFRQSYNGGTLAVTSRKTLEFHKINGRWLIQRELSGG